MTEGWKIQCLQQYEYNNQNVFPSLNVKVHNDDDDDNSKDSDKFGSRHKIVNCEKKIIIPKIWLSVSWLEKD